MTAAERVKYFYEVIVSENKTQRMGKFVSRDCYVRVGGSRVPVGVEGMAAHIAATKSTYPDYAMRVTRQFCDGDTVISEFVMEGTHLGEWLGIRPSGKRLSFTGVNIDRVADGKIVEHGGAVNTFETLLEANLIGPVSHGEAGS